MSAIILEISEPYLRSFGTTEEEVRRNAKLTLAVGMYRQGRWSMEDAADFAEINVEKFTDALRERHVRLQPADEIRLASSVPDSKSP